MSYDQGLRELERRAREGDPEAAARLKAWRDRGRHTFVLPKLHETQQQVAEHPARFKVCVAGRRWRKTSLGVCEGIRRAFAGQHVWWVAPTFPLTGMGWRMAIGLAQQLPGCVVRQSTRTITFRHGHGWFQVKSADAGDCVGEGLDYVIVDEAARVKTADVWEQQIRPALSDRRGGALFISTPKGDNWFRRLYEFAVSEAGSRDGWAGWRLPSSSNPYMRPEELAEAKRLLPAWVFEQEYGANFTVPGGGMFKHANHRFYRWAADHVIECRHGTLVERYDVRTLSRFATVDLAASVNEAADYTCISCWAASSTGKLFLLDLLRDRLGVPAIMPALHARIARWDLDYAAIESVAFQLGFVQDARRQGVPVRELERGKGRVAMTDTPANVAAKVARAMPAAVYHAGGQVWWPTPAPTWWPELERELETFPMGEHDDQVDTVSDAVELTREFSGYVPPAAPDTGAGRDSSPLGDAAPRGSPWG